MKHARLMPNFRKVECRTGDGHCRLRRFRRRRRFHLPSRRPKARLHGPGGPNATLHPGVRSGTTRLGRALQQRKSRRAARVCDRAERGPYQNRTAGGVGGQYPGGQATPERRSRSCNCRSASISPAGAKLQVDDGKSVRLPIQTCESRGCYASIPVSPGNAEERASIRQAIEGHVPGSRQGNHRDSDFAHRFFGGLRQDQIDRSCCTAPGAAFWLLRVLLRPKTALLADPEIGLLHLRFVGEIRGFARQDAFCADLKDGCEIGYFKGEFDPSTPRRARMVSPSRCSRPNVSYMVSTTAGARPSDPAHPASEASDRSHQRAADRWHLAFAARHGAGAPVCAARKVSERCHRPVQAASPRALLVMQRRRAKLPVVLDALLLRAIASLPATAQAPHAR